MSGRAGESPTGSGSRSARLAAANRALELAELATDTRPVRSVIAPFGQGLVGLSGDWPSNQTFEPTAQPIAAKLPPAKTQPKPPSALLEAATGNRFGRPRLISRPGSGLSRCTLPELRASARALLSPGQVAQVTGSTNALFAVAAGVWGPQDWGVVAGLRNAGYLAAAQAGVPLDRCVVVPDLGNEALPVLAALIDAYGVVVLGQDMPPLTAADRRRLEARLRHQQGCLITSGTWGGAQLCLTATLEVTQPFRQTGGLLPAGIWRLQWSGPAARAGQWEPVASPAAAQAQVQAGQTLALPLAQSAAVTTRRAALGQALALPLSQPAAASRGLALAEPTVQPAVAVANGAAR
ncbi:MAG: hypothetical protein FWG16_06010 [Micrococcales bacterium]|nr:hypothetical protein [Micrococcales bacterium]